MNERKGKLILQSIPDRRVKIKVVNFLLKLAKNAPREAVEAKLQSLPATLIHDLPESAGRKLAESLTQLGAAAIFIPCQIIRNDASADATTPAFSKTIFRAETGAAPRKNREGGSIFNRRWLVPFLMVIVVMGLSVYSGMRGFQERAITEQQKADLPSRAPESERIAVQPNAVRRNLLPPFRTVMDVPPEKMYAHFLHQYRIRPDRRFVDAFEKLTSLYQRIVNPQGTGTVQSVGDIEYRDRAVMIPFLQDGVKTSQVVLPVPMTFAAGMSTLSEWLELLKTACPLTPQTVLQTHEGWEAAFQEALRDFHRVDARSVIRGLLSLEQLWLREGPDPRVLLGAVRGYAMLVLGLIPDRMQRGDEFISFALGCLVLAKGMAPACDAAGEEALLAMVMGYTAHSEAVQKRLGFKSADPDDLVLGAYMKRNSEALIRRMHSGSPVLGPYLLARLYREMGLRHKAAHEIGALYQQFPNVYPVLAEMIHSGNLSTAKRLSVTYPKDILVRMEVEMSPVNLLKVFNWTARLKRIAGYESAAGVSFSEFETLLSKWRPLGLNSAENLLIDSARIKEIFRCLYEGAVDMHFDLLMNRWAVADRAEAYVSVLAGADRDRTHPMVLAMKAELTAKTGKHDEFQSVSDQLLGSADVNGTLGFYIHSFAKTPLNRIRWAPRAIGALDGRPRHLFLRALVLETISSLDLSETSWRLGLERNPFEMNAYTHLARITGDDADLVQALQRFPYNHRLLEAAGDYYGGGSDSEAKETALKCYRKACALAPSRYQLTLKTSKTLAALERYSEAIDSAADWIERFGSPDLDTAVLKSNMARNYIKLAAPEKALEILTREPIDQYQAGVMLCTALAHEALGDRFPAEVLFEKAVERYPVTPTVIAEAAAFLWRRDRHAEAAELIAKGRRVTGDFSRWYFPFFMKVFGGSEISEIMPAVDALIQAGAAHWEITALGFEYHWIKRYDLAWRIMNKSPRVLPMQQLEIRVAVCGVIQEWKGGAAADTFLAESVPPHMHGPLTSVLYKKGLFEPILKILQYPDSFPEKYREFVWLQKLLAWLALGRPACGAADDFEPHYAKVASEDYAAVGKFLLNKISRSDLLERIRSPKQRCEFAYYIGFKERLQGNFREASRWYQICRETLLSNNGEFHWASEELYRWSRVGSTRRHRLLREDITVFREKALTDRGGLNETG